MRLFDNFCWLFLASMVAWAFYGLMLVFKIRLSKSWSVRRAVAGLLVGTIGMMSSLASIDVPIQQLGSIVGFVALAHPAIQFWKRLTYQFFDQLAILGIEIGLLGGISTKLMIQGGGLPYFCHILADMLLCAGAYCLLVLNNNQNGKREHTGTA